MRVIVLPRGDGEIAQFSCGSDPLLCMPWRAEPDLSFLNGSLSGCKYGSRPPRLRIQGYGRDEAKLEHASPLWPLHHAGGQVGESRGDNNL